MIAKLAIEKLDTGRFKGEPEKEIKEETAPKKAKQRNSPHIVKSLVILSLIFVPFSVQVSVFSLRCSHTTKCFVCMPVFHLVFIRSPLCVGNLSRTFH